MKQEDNVYKMSDLVRLSGVSKQTIHFYLREGLLLPPERTSKNMAYYNESTADDIRFIKELQEKRYLPLNIIKEILKAKREGYDLAEEDHLILYDQMFNLGQTDLASQQFDKISFLKRSGLTEQELSQLSTMGIVSASAEGGDGSFDGHDLAVVEALKGLMVMGMSLEDLRLYDSFLKFAYLEIEMVHDRVIQRNSEEKHYPIRRIYSELERVKNLLTSKAYREFFINHRHEESIKKGDMNND